MLDDRLDASVKFALEALLDRSHFVLVRLDSFLVLLLRLFILVHLFLNFVAHFLIAVDFDDSGSFQIVDLFLK